MKCERDAKTDSKAMSQRPLRLLVAEGQLDDIFLLQEALSEMSEGRYWRVWMRELKPVFVDRIDDTLQYLRQERWDAILLSLSLPDSRGLHTYMRARAEAPSTPIIILASDVEEALAASAVREGAQDYIIRSEIDSAPLARSIRHAVERQHLSESLRRMVHIDDLTGLYNQKGFAVLAEHYLRLSARLRQHLTLMLTDIWAAEFDGVSDSCRRLARTERDLAVREAARLVLPAFDESTIIGRLGAARFGVIAIDDDAPPPLEGTLRRCVSAHNARPARRCRLIMTTGSVHLDKGCYRTYEEVSRLAESALCENERGELPEFHSLRPHRLE